MALYARSRPGTTPSFWRGYHNAQLKVASACMRSVASGVLREASIDGFDCGFREKEDSRLLLILSTLLASNRGHCMTLR